MNTNKILKMPAALSTPLPLLPELTIWSIPITKPPIPKIADTTKRATYELASSSKDEDEFVKFSKDTASAIRTKVTIQRIKSTRKTNKAVKDNILDFDIFKIIF
jgi:hypothetical protein